MRRWDRLGSMPLAGLRARYQEVYGEDARTAHRLHLVRRIACRLPVQAQGDLWERARLARPGNRQRRGLEEPSAAALGGPESDRRDAHRVRGPAVWVAQCGGAPLPAPAGMAGYSSD